MVRGISPPPPTPNFFLKIYVSENAFQAISISTSNVCGLYCAYYVMKRHQGKTMKDIVKDFNVKQKKRNDRLIVTKMMKLCTRKRPVQRK